MTDQPVVDAVASATVPGMSRRGLVRASAIALVGAPAAAISGRMSLSAAPLEALSFDDWGQRRGMGVLVLGDAGPIPATIDAATALPNQGARPASLPRAFAFEITLLTDLAAAPSGDATYEVWLGSQRSALFLARRADTDGKAVFKALFN